MSSKRAKTFLVRLRTDRVCRKEFENAWRGRAVALDEELELDTPPIVPLPLAPSIPDSKTDPDGYRSWYAGYNAMKEIHTLLFAGTKVSLGTPGNPYSGEEVVTTRATLSEALQAPPVLAGLEHLARIASAIEGEPITSADTQAAYLDFVCAVFKLRPQPTPHPEVTRLVSGARAQADLEQGLAAVLPAQVPTALGHATQAALSAGFPGAFGFSEAQASRELVQALQRFAEEAAQAGYVFSALEFLEDRLARHAEHHASKPDACARAWQGDGVDWEAQQLLSFHLGAYPV